MSQMSDSDVESDSQMQESEITEVESSISEREASASNLKEKEEASRGRPVGKADSTKRYRRTAAEISADKIQVAQMKLDALRESETHKLANKKNLRARPRSALSDKTMRVIDEEPIPARQRKSHLSPMKIPTPQSSNLKERSNEESERTPTPERPERGHRQSRQALYDSWFPSSPRTNHTF